MNGDAVLDLDAQAAHGLAEVAGAEVDPGLGHDADPNSGAGLRRLLTATSY